MDSQPLDFEKPILELQRRLQELKSHSDQHDIDFDSEVESMEIKIRETRRQIYDNLTAWQRVQIARHVQRPFALDYIGRCFTEWVELHGDRVFGDDKACRAASPLGSHRCVVISRRGATPRRCERNFGCAYRRAIARPFASCDSRRIQSAVISLIDTRGLSESGPGAPHREAITINLREMMTLRVPIIATMIGEAVPMARSASG
jgi:acetyl-CoA carboxylase carboxyl transferase subunit alpha